MPCTPPAHVILPTAARIMTTAGAPAQVRAGRRGHPTADRRRHPAAGPARAERRRAQPGHRVRHADLPQGAPRADRGRHPGARPEPRTPAPASPTRAPPALERDLADATRALSAGLAAARHAAGLTQVELAALAGVSVTTVGHAETGRTWQSRRFWERADTALCAAGDLLRLHDAYRAASSPTKTTGPARRARLTRIPRPRAPLAGAPLLRLSPLRRPRLRLAQL